MVVDVRSTLGDSWLAQKDKRTFYIKKTIKYGSWNIVWDPDTVDDTAWTGGTVHVNAYATRTNTIREGFNYRQETETEYCTITYTPTLTDCELSGSAGAEGYTFTWGEYNITSENRTITLIASHTSGTSTKELTQLKRDKYVIGFVNQTPDDPNNETYIAYKPDIIPASGGRLDSVPYTYIVLYNTGETEKKQGVLDISDKNVYASSKGAIESEKTIVTTIPGSDLGTLPAIDGVTVGFPNLTIYQAENKKYSNNDNKTVTTNVTLSATPTTVYTKGGLITFTSIRTYDSYSDSYTWDSGTITPSDIIHNNTEELSEFPLTYIINGETNTIPSTNTFNIGEYTEGDRIISFNTYYIDTDGTKIDSNIVNINQLMDYKIDGSDVYESLNVSLSYSNISEEVPYTFSASGGSLIMNDINRVTLTVTYIHKWTMIEAGEQQEIITKSLAPSSEQQLLKESEYSFNVVSYTANNLGTTITPINDNLITITVTVTPEGTTLTQQASAILTQQGNTEDPMPIEGSEEAVRLDVTVSPTSVSYEGGNITLDAEYFYTEKHLMTSGVEKTENKQKNVSEFAQWAYKSKTGTNPETLLQELSIGTTSHTISEIDPVSTNNVVYTYYATYNGISGNGVVTQIPDQQIDEYYKNLVITNYSYPTINDTDYHIANTGGTLISATWTDKILSATVDHVIVYEKTGEHVLTENVNMEKASVSYSKEQISGDNLGTQEYVDNINKGTIVVTVNVSDGKDGYLIDTKESNIIYQQKNTKTLNTQTYKNAHITSPIEGTTVDNGENTITLSLVYNMVQTYLFETGAEKQETTYNIDGTELTTWYVNGELYGTNKNSYTIEALGPTVLEDKVYVFTAKITLGTQEFSDNITVLQKAKTVLYQKNLTLQISYPVFAEGVTYHIPAYGGVAVSSNLSGTYSYIDVYSDGTESAVHTYYIDTLTDSEKILNATTIEYGSKGTSIASEDFVMFNNAITSPKSFTLQVKPSNVKGQDGTVLTSNSATATIKQEANEALTGDDNITISYKDFTIQNTNPVSLSSTGGTVNLIAMCTKTTATKYTSGSVKTVDEPNLTVTTDTTWSVNNVELTRGISTYNIEQFSDFENRTFVIDAEYQGLTDTITIIQTARALTGEYYKDVALYISYPVFEEGVTYHIPASGGTVDNNKITGTFEYTKVLTYDDNSEIQQNHETVTISSILDIWKTWTPNTTQDIDSLGTLVKEESNTGKSITLTISPDSWKDKNGNNISVSDTVYIIQQKNDNGSIPTTPAYDIYDEVVLTASPTSFNNNGGTCNLTAILHYTSYADTYTWTSGATSGGESTKNTKNISNETDIVYSAKKNDSNVSLIYTNGFSTKNVNIPSRTAGTMETDIYVFTVTTTYQGIDGNMLTASTENVIQAGDNIKSIYYENLVISINYDEYILGGNKENSTHYHFAANGKAKNNAEQIITNTASKSAVITRVDVWEQQGEVRTHNIDITNNGTWTYDTPSVTASNLDTNEIPRMSVKTITATFNSGLTDKTGTVLSETCSDTLYQEANTALTGSDNVVVTWKDFSIQATNPTELSSQGGTVNLSATVTKVTTTTYTSGNKKSIDDVLINVTTLSSWSVNGTSLTAGSTAYTISRYTGEETQYYVFEATYEGLSDNLSVTQLARVKTGEYYKDLALSISYPYVTGTTYHIGAEGGTVNNNNVLGIFKYTKVIIYDDGSEEVVIDNKEESISLISDSWKSFTPNSEQTIDSRGILEASEGDTGKSISLTVAPTGWHLKNGEAASVQDTVNITQQGNISSVFKTAYNDYTNLSLTANPNSFNNNGGTCDLTAILQFTHHDTEYVWTSGSHSGGKISYDSKNVSIESGSIYTATKNGSSVSLTYTNNTNSKSAIIPSRDAGTTTDDTYVFTITTNYKTPSGTTLSATSGDVIQEGDEITSIYYENLEITYDFNNHVIGGTIDANTHYHFDASGMNGSNESFTAGSGNYQAHATKVTVWAQQGEVRQTDVNVSNSPDDWTFTPSNNTNITASDLGTTNKSRSLIQTVTATFERVDLKDKAGNNLTGSGTADVYQQENSRSTSYSISATFDISATPETNTYAQTTINLNALYQETFTYTWTSGQLQDIVQPQQDVTLNTIFSYKSSDSSVTENLGKNIISHTLSANTSHTLIKTTTYTGTYKDLTDTASVTQSPDSIDTTVNGDGIWYKDISVLWDYPYVSGTNYHVAVTGGTKTISNNTSSINTSNGYIPANTYYVQYKKVTRYLSGDVEDSDYTKKDITKLSVSERSFDKTTVTVSSLGATYEPNITNTGVSFTLTVTPSGIKNDNGTQLSANYTVYLLQQENIYDSTSPVFTSIVVEKYDSKSKVLNNSPSVRLTATGTYHYILTTGASTADETISLHSSEYSTYWKAFKNTSTTAYKSTFTGYDNYMEATITRRPNGTPGDVNYWFQVVYSDISSNKLNVVQEGDYSYVSLSNLNISFDWDNYKITGQDYHFTAAGYLGPDGSTSDGSQLDETMLNKSATATETTRWIYSGVPQNPTTKTVHPTGTWTFKANTSSNRGLTASTLSFDSNIIITGNTRSTVIDEKQGQITVTGQFVPSDSQLSSTTKTYTVYQQQNTRTKKTDHITHNIKSNTIVTWEGDTVILKGIQWYYYLYTSNRTSDVFSEGITNTGSWYYYISDSSSTPSTTVSGRVNQKLESIPLKESASNTYYWTWITYNGFTSTPKYICQKSGGADRSIYWYKYNSAAVWSDGSTSTYKQTTVSFNSYLSDASAPSTVLTPYGAETTANFIGWYYDGSNYQDSTLRVTSSDALSLYAQWDNICYRITWDAGSGNVFQTSGERYAYSYVPSINGGHIWYTDDKHQFTNGPGIPTKTGYSFSGFVKQGTTSPQYTSAFNHDNSSDTYIAQYTVRTYTITWDAETNGGTFPNGLGTTTTSAAYGTTYYNITRPSAGDPIKYFDMGYYPLSSWNTNKSGTGTSASSTSAAVYENITFYAIYSSTPTYTKAYVTYYANGGTFADGNTKITNTYSYGTIIRDTYPSNPTRTNYAFDGWYWDQNCTDAVTGTEEISSQDINIYAKWVRTYTVSFIGDEHAHWNPTSVIVRDGGKSSSVLSFDTGYEKDSASGYSSFSGNKYYSKAASSTNTNPTVYATSKPKQYTVTWYKNNSNVKWSSDNTDTNTYKATKVNYNTVYNDLTAPSILTPQSDSTYQYRFIEWNRSSSGSGVSKTSTSDYVTGSDVVFYAIWNISKLPQIIWNANGGYLSDGSTQKTETGTLGMQWSAVKRPTNPTRTNYVFKDWYNAAEGGTVLRSITGRANSGDVLTLYAHWNPIYHITINPNGGTLTYPSTSYSDLTTTSELTIDLVYEPGTVYRNDICDTIAEMYGTGNWETWWDPHLTPTTILQRKGYILEYLYITDTNEIVQYGNSEYFETGTLVNSSYEWIYTSDVHITAKWKEITYTPVFLSK